MRLAAVTCFHAREYLSCLFVEHTTKLMPLYTCPDDTPNDPLGAKWNAALSTALRSDATHFMILGSDDFVDPCYVERVIASNTDLCVPSSIAAVEPSTGRACLMHYKDQGGRTYGAGRVVSRALVDRIILERGHYWTPSRNSGLDTDTWHFETMYSDDGHHLIRDSYPALCDVKTPVNLHPIDRLLHLWKAQAIAPQEALHMVSDDMFDRIMTVR